MAVNTSKSIRNQVIYQIFTRNYRGGTFRAVEEDLPRIQALGVDYVYLLPIQPSGKVNRKGSMGSPYAISDYRAIDPEQGTMESFIHLTEAIHAAGMKVMIDVVYNHTAPDSVLSREHPEWFYRKEDGSFGNHVGQWWDVIDLDYSDKGLWDYQIETLKMWAKYVDGFRCDVAPLVPLEFWKRARAEVAQVRPDCLWVAESVEPEFIRIARKMGLEASSDGELYQAFDILYDHDVYHRMAGVATGENSLGEYLAGVNLQECAYPGNFSKLRCLENHDRTRAAALWPEDQQLKNWTAWNYFATGTVMLYAGQEFCCRHHPTLFDRDTVDFETGKDISGYLKTLSNIKRNPIFAEGCFEAKTIGKDQDVIFAVRETKDRKLVGIFSSTGKQQPLKVDIPDGCCKNLITGENVDVFERNLLFAGEPIMMFVEK